MEFYFRLNKNYFIFNELKILFKLSLIKIKLKWDLGIGDGGLGIGDLGIGDWAQSPIPNPQSPIPNPQSPYNLKNEKKLFMN